MTKDETARDMVRLRHILDECAEIKDILARNDRSKLAEAALERKYIIIGEACRAISNGLKETYLDIPWSDIIAMRNVLVHEYYKVEKEALWNVAEDKIPALKDLIKGVLAKHNGAEAV